MGMIGNAPYQGVIDTGNIVDGAVTAAKLKAAADITNKLGYTPANKAGDTMTGALVVQQSVSSTVNDANFNLGGQRAVMDFWPGGSRARIGAVNGGGAAVGLDILANGQSVISSDSSGRITIPNQPNACWKLVISGGNSRNLTILTNTGSCVTSITNPIAGSYGMFTAPIGGRYLVTVNGMNIGSQPSGATNKSPCLISLYGSWSTTSNIAFPGQEWIDTRSAQVDNIGASIVLNLAQGDTVGPDWYHSGTGYESSGEVQTTVTLIG